MGSKKSNQAFAKMYANQKGLKKMNPRYLKLGQVSLPKTLLGVCLVLSPLGVSRSLSAVELKEVDEKAAPAEGRAEERAAAQREPATESKSRPQVTPTGHPSLLESEKKRLVEEAFLEREEEAQEERRHERDAVEERRHERDAVEELEPEKPTGLQATDCAAIHQGVSRQAAGPEAAATRHQGSHPSSGAAAARGGKKPGSAGAADAH